MNYESILREAVHNVICIYGDQLNRKEINRLTKREFRKISDEYPMKYVQQDALTAFVCNLKGKRWINYNTRRKLTQREREFNERNHPVQRDAIEDLIEQLHHTPAYRGKTVARGKRKVIR